MHFCAQPSGWGSPAGGHTLTQLSGSMGPILPSGHVVAVGSCGAGVGTGVVGFPQGKMGGKHLSGLA